MESDFLRMSLIYAEDNLPIYERWMRILEYLPDARGRHIYDDFTATLKEVYQRGTDIRAGALVDLMFLRQHFFEMLRDNGIGRAHTNTYEIEASAVWRDKLLERIADVDPARIKRGQYTPAKIEPSTQHKWLQ